MILCPRCRKETDESSGLCSHCRGSLDGIASSDAAEIQDRKLSETQPSPDDDHYTVPFSISVSDAHVLLFNWLEKQMGEDFKRDYFHILRMNKKYYGCWLFWFSIPTGDGDSDVSPIDEASQKASETGKRKKIVIIPGSDSVPADVLTLSGHYDFMELTLLEQKITSSPEYTSIERSEKQSYEDALASLREEEPAIFDEQGKLNATVTLLHGVPLALPIWEGAFDNRGGKECSFFINGQKGQVEGQEFLNGKSFSIRRFVPYVLGATGLLLILVILFWIFKFLGSGELPEPGSSISSTPDSTINVMRSKAPDNTPFTPPVTASAMATPAETISSSPSESVLPSEEPSPSMAASPSASPSVSPSASPSASVSPSPEKTGATQSSDEKQALAAVQNNFKAINDRDFKTVYDLRALSVQKGKSKGFYEKQYADNISISLVDSQVDKCSPDEAKIKVSLLSKDTMEGKKRQGKYEGWFLLVKEKGEWKIVDSSLKLVPGSLE